MLGRPRSPLCLWTHLRDKTGRFFFRALISAPNRIALRFSEVRWLSRIPSSYDALSLWQGGRVKHPEPAMEREQVSRIVAEAEKNRFAAGIETLNFLDAYVKRLRPNAILEFGSGVSTLVLAARMAAIHGGTAPRVFSIDESQGYLDETRQMLDHVGLRDHARLAQRDVHEQLIFGRATTCYDLDEGFLRSFLLTAPDFVFVDGPSGGGMVRFGTLPLVLEHLGPRCTFFLDDALRETRSKSLPCGRRSRSLSSPPFTCSATVCSREESCKQRCIRNASVTSRSNDEALPAHAMESAGIPPLFELGTRHRPALAGSQTRTLPPIFACRAWPGRRHATSLGSSSSTRVSCPSRTSNGFKLRTSAFTSSPLKTPRVRDYQRLGKRLVGSRPTRIGSSRPDSTAMTFYIETTFVKSESTSPES
jgi:hypothetical protein